MSTLQVAEFAGFLRTEAWLHRSEATNLMRAGSEGRSIANLRSGLDGMLEARGTVVDPTSDAARAFLARADRSLAHVPELRTHLTSSIEQLGHLDYMVATRSTRLHEAPLHAMDGAKGLLDQARLELQQWRLDDGVGRDILALFDDVIAGARELAPSSAP